MHPVKMLGQNFLVDSNVIDRIIQIVDPQKDDHILEIGPGQGALTRKLLAEDLNLTAVELDKRLAPLLTEEFASNGRVEILEADILDLDLCNTLTNRFEGKWKVAANLPYNISSQILFKFLETPQLFLKLVLMLQKEVGERLVALPGCKEYGILTPLCNLHFDIKKEFIVRPGSFNPSPKVDSVVLSFIPLQKPRVDVGDEKLFRRIVKGAFGQRRKTLNNSLKAAFPELLPDILSEIFKVASIDPLRRGETLSISEFARLTNAFLTF